MEFPNDPVPYDVLMTHVKELHLHSPIQLPSQTDLMGNCTTFAVSLTTDLSKKYFPNGSPLAGQVPHRIQFSPQAHMNIITPPDVPRYTLPKELMPGVPWPPGFRDDFNNWSRNFLGTTNILPRGTMYMLGNRHVVMRPDDVVKISGL